MKRSILTLLVLALIGTTAEAADYTVINNPDFPTHDVAVATYTATDYGVDNTGSTDCTAKVQQLLDKLAGVGTQSNERGNYANLAGGILYLPAGKYLFRGQLVIPRGVTLRGDWRQPTDGEGVKGTVLVIDASNGEGQTDQSKAFITMQPATEVSHVAFWYKNQTIGSVKQYPPTVLFGQRGYWGNEFSNVRHATFVNSYTAIASYLGGSGGSPNIFDVYGTPLGEGVVIDCLADVGRFDGIHWAPSYWADSQLAGAPSEENIKAWTYDHATGFVMRRNDWSYTCNYDCDGYRCAFSAEPSAPEANTKGTPNGHNYLFRFKNCQTGIELKGVSGAGIMFTRVQTAGCETAIHLGTSIEGSAQFMGCQLGATGEALRITENAGSTVMLQQCDVTAPVNIEAGSLLADQCTFSRDVSIGTKARTVFTGNTFSGGARLQNRSVFECAVSETGSGMNSLPEFKEEWMAIRDTKPAKNTLYIVDIEPLTVLDDLSTAPDCRDKIQSTLNQAGANGGGIVYLKPGHYRVNGGYLRIPKGVELKGASDITAMPKGQGAVLECFANEGFENYNAFIVMDEGSGLRGISINYPKQDNPLSLIKYPYSIRGNKDCYIVNVALRTAYRGIDLFTNKCDNHYVDGVTGHCFMNVIRVGGGSEGGLISNIQCNTIIYAAGDESKWGCWPNSEKMKDSYGLGYDQIAYCQNYEQLDFMIVGDTREQVLYNNFLFGCNKGLVLQNDDNGRGAYHLHAVGNAVDGAMNTFVINGASDDVDLVNSQVVAFNHVCSHRPDYDLDLRARFVSTSADFQHTVTFYNSCHWGSADYFADILGGKVNLTQANLRECGAVRSFSVADGCSLDIHQAQFRPVKQLVENAQTMNQRIAISESIVAPKPNEYWQNFAAWDNNLPIIWNMKDGVAEDRTYWKAYAFNDTEGKGTARYLIDGDISTQWTTVAPQVADGSQWIRIDFGSLLTLNNLFLQTTSTNDGPAAYRVQILNPSTGSWKEVATGENGGTSLMITFPDVKTQQVRITLTGEKSNYWTIGEINIARADYTNGISETTVKTAHSDAIYDLQGRIVTAANLKKGIYITGGRKFFAR